MNGGHQSERSARIEVRNVGGIQAADITIPPGVTVLRGENATNRTSFLQAIRAALGSTAATLKGDATSGRVELTIDGETYHRELERVESGVAFSGSPYLDDPTVGDAFAFLLEDNEARQAVVRDGDLGAQILRPVDTERLTAEIQRLEREKASVTAELDDIESRQRELPDLEAKRESIREEIATERDRLADIEAEIDETELERRQADQSAFEETLASLRETRSELESVRRELESQTESIESLRAELADIDAELDELPAPEDGPDDLDADIEALRNHRQTLNAELSELQSLIQYNEERLDADDVTEWLATDSDEGSPTDQLLAPTESDVVCWTCGSTVDREQITGTVDRLREVRQQRLDELESVKSTLEERREEQRERERARQRRAELEARRSEVESERQRRRERVDSLTAKRDRLTDEVAELEETRESFDTGTFDEVLALHSEANELEFDIDNLETQLESVIDSIADIEAELSRAESLRERRDRLADQLTEKRNRIDRIEAEAVSEFNDHMAAILDRLEYDNIERIWIERRDGDTGSDGATFDLHVVRTTANGAAYEDTVDHLSESERAVTGLVFALAGYLVHEVHETVPFMLLDSLEAIDADRIARLVSYFADYATYLVVALLPEDAQALDESYTRVGSI